MERTARRGWFESRRCTALSSPVYRTLGVKSRVFGVQDCRTHIREDGAFTSVPVIKIFDSLGRKGQLCRYLPEGRRCTAVSSPAWRTLGVKSRFLGVQNCRTHTWEDGAFTSALVISFLRLPGQGSWVDTCPKAGAAQQYRVLSVEGWGKIPVSWSAELQDS